MSVYTTSTGTYSGENYTMYSFLSGTDVIQFDRNVTAYVLVVGGGGGGGAGQIVSGIGETGSGGGAGAMVTFSYTFLANTKYYIVVGKGGPGGAQLTTEVTNNNVYHRYASKGTNGENSRIYSTTLGTNVNVIAYGGGGGAAPSQEQWFRYDARAGSSGGSGGGGNGFYLDQAGSTSAGGAVGPTKTLGVTANTFQNVGAIGVQGSAGAGGGGAGAAGASGGSGGAGKQWEIDSIFYAGGGSGSGNGGSGGGGKGGNAVTDTLVNGTPNSGGGGGGASTVTTTPYPIAGCGGSGIVKIAFLTSLGATLTCTGTGPGRTNILRADHIAYYYPLSTNIYDYATGTAIDNASMYNFTLTNNNIVSSNRLGQMFKIPKIQLNGSGFTVSFWMRIDSGYTGEPRIFDFGKGTPDSNILLRVVSGVLTLSVYRDTVDANAYSVTMMSINVNTLYFFALVFDAANPYTIRCQLNDTMYTYTAQNYRYPTTFELPNCYFGKGCLNNDTSTSKLYLKQIAIFYRALHDTEINTMYDNNGTTFQLVYTTMPANAININNNRLAYYYSFNNNYSCDIPELGIPDIITYNTTLITNDNVTGTKALNMTTSADSYSTIDSFAPGKYGYTISFWAKVSSSTAKQDNAVMFAFVPNATFPSLGISMYNRINQSGYVDGLVVFTSNGAREGGANYYSDLNTGYIQDGNWHHFCITQKQFTGTFPDAQIGDISLHIDGVLYASASAYYPYTYLNPSYISIGTDVYSIGDNATNTFNVKMNNFIMFYRVLTNDEIRYLYSVPQPASITFTANPTTPVLTSASPYQVNSTGMAYPVGSVLAYMGSTDPDGWVICDGLPRYVFDSRYRNLLQIGIGTGTPNQYTPPNYRASVLRGTGSKVAYNPSSSNNTATFTGPPIGQAQEVKSVSGSKRLSCIGVNWIIKL